MESVFPPVMPRSMNFRSQRSQGEYNLCTSGFFRKAAGEERLARGAWMTIVDDHSAIADEHFTADGHAGARIEIWETLHLKGINEDLRVSIR